MFMSLFSVTILGCSSATPTRRHQPSCQIVDYRGSLMMIDCGEGAQSGMRRFGFKFSRLTHIFISHLHGDHCFGLPGLVSTMALHQKGGCLTIHMLPEGIAVFKPFLDYFCRDTPFSIQWQPLSATATRVVLDTPALTVESFPLYHRVPCVGFKFTEKPKRRHLRADMIKFYNIPLTRLAAIKEGADYVTPAGEVIANSRLTTDADPQASYAYCSDTVADPRLIPSVAGVDVLYHEATYADDNAQLAAPRGHSTARSAAALARSAGVGRLVIGHFSRRYSSEDSLLAEAKEEFAATTLADEGLRIDLA